MDHLDSTTTHEGVKECEGGGGGGGGEKEDEVKGKGEREEGSTLTLTVPERLDLAWWTNGFPNLYSICRDTYTQTQWVTHSSTIYIILL